MKTITLQSLVATVIFGFIAIETFLCFFFFYKSFTSSLDLRGMFVFIFSCFFAQSYFLIKLVIDMMQNNKVK